MEFIEKVKAGGIAAISLAVITIIACFAAWITHLVVCFQDGEWGFLIAGALVAPIAIIHGFGAWFGWW